MLTLLLLTAKLEVHVMYPLPYMQLYSGAAKQV